MSAEQDDDPDVIAPLRAQGERHLRERAGDGPLAEVLAELREKRRAAFLASAHTAYGLDVAVMVVERHLGAASARDEAQ